MFYTEYRPQNFKDLIGAEHIVSAITGALLKNKPAHAYFFYGSRGTGKTTTARLVAKALNCESPIVTNQTFEPCGECLSCKSISNGNHLDLIEIDAASNRGIDNIRDLKENVNLSPTMGKNKIYIIDEVHMLTVEASNALLKLLEEPPTHAYFILCTTNPEKVLDTIKSRCQQFKFKRPDIENLVKKISSIAEDKEFELSDSDFVRIAVSAKGAYREAETILEQIINGETSLDILLDEKSSNYPLFTQMLLKGSAGEAINFIHEIYKNGNNLERWNERYIAHCRGLLMSKLGVAVDEEVNISDHKDISVDSLTAIIKRFTQVTSEFKFAIIETLPLEIAIIEVTSLFNPQNELKSAKPIVSKDPEVKDVKKVKNDEDSKSQNINNASDEKSSQDEQMIDSKVTNDLELKPFPFQDLIETVKPHNHSIYLILYSCDVIGFDGKTLTLQAYFSFHKERILSLKVKEIIQTEAEKLTGTKIALKCVLSDKKPDAKRLTDKNVKMTKDKIGIEEVFEKVFGDDMEEA